MFEWLRRKKEKKDNTLPRELTNNPTQPPSLPTVNQSYKKDMKTIQLEDKKDIVIPEIKKYKIHRPRRRKYHEINNEILTLLRFSPTALPTSTIAEKVRIDPVNCKRHLERLEFEGFVERYSQGKNKRWNYWKIKR